MTETSTPERIQSLARTFRQEPSDTRRRIIIALRAMGGAGVKQIGTLLQTEQTLTDEDVCGIVRTLVDVQRQGLKSAEEAVRALISPLCAARGKLIRAILAEGGKVGRQWLIEALQKGGDSQRWDIVYAVGQAPAQGVSILQAAMRGHSDYAACAAAKYLGASGSQEAAKVLLPYVRPFTLRDPDYQLRLAVIEALGELKAPEAAEPLSLVLAKKSFWRRRSSDALRLAAARALAAIGTEEALKSLARYARKERNAQIRELARRASQAAAPT